MMNEYLKTEGLAVGYDGRAIIRDICLSIRRGEIVTLIGPNGSGKSTILKSITRQLSTIGGTVTLDGQALRSFSYRDLAVKMAVVLTERMKPELMTCRDIAATGRYPYTGRMGLLSREDEQKVTDALKRVHALEIADRDFNAISDGQRQRVLLARAICQEPEIIILDEPTSYLDIRHKLELLSILRSMAKEKGITVVMSLHEIDLAQKISDRVVCVKGETISRFGTPDEVFTEETIRALYDIEHGSYDALYGSIELPKPEGEPKVFVISGCGTGIPVYRRLQKEDIPFSAGILYTNDIDLPAAKALAARVITEEAFAPISDRAYEAAIREIDACECVICTGFPIGAGNARMEALIRYAGSGGKLERV